MPNYKSFLTTQQEIFVECLINRQDITLEANTILRKLSNDVFLVLDKKYINQIK